MCRPPLVPVLAWTPAERSHVEHEAAVAIVVGVAVCMAVSVRCLGAAWHLSRSLAAGTGYYARD
jgi:hypothetical protein